MKALKTPHIYISAGEASGDFLGAHLATAIFRKKPSIKLTGMGSTRMAQAGVSLQFDAKRLSVVGLTEVITRLPRILFTIRKIKQYLHQSKPDLIILIDFPDTHLHIAKSAKKN